MGAETGSRNGRWSRLEARLRGLSPRRRVLTLLLVAMIVYGSFIIISTLLLQPLLDQSNFGTTDLSVFQERARLILNGGIIYRDVPFLSFPVESPPIINYLFLPPQLAGGEGWAYEIWFSLFALLSSLATYLVLREWDDHLAFVAALILLLCPSLVLEATMAQQDEPIVVFLFILPVLLFLRKSFKGATASVSIGFWTKFLSIILFPAILIHIPTWKERFRHIGLAALISLAIALPFLIICPVEFLLFPTYYMLGSNDGGAGMSAIGLMSDGGLVVPGTIGALVTVAALLVTYWYCWKRRLDIWRSCLLVTVVFLSIYPMIRLSYFILPFSFLVVWAAEDRRVLLRIIGMYIPLSIANVLDFSIDDGNVPIIFSWVALVFLISGLVILADATRIALRNECFLDRSRAGAAPLFRTAPSAIVSTKTSQDAK